LGDFWANFGVILVLNLVILVIFGDFGAF